MPIYARSLAGTPVAGPEAVRYLPSRMKRGWGRPGAGRAAQSPLVKILEMCAYRSIEIPPSYCIVCVLILLFAPLVFFPFYSYLLICVQNRPFFIFYGSIF